MIISIRLLIRNRKMWFCVIYLTVLSIGGNVLRTANGLSTTNDRDSRKLFGGYRITPKFCRASKTLPRSDPRARGPTICMFNHECTQRQGEVVGACMDGFLFGACCQLQGTIDSPLVIENESILGDSNSQISAAQSYESYGQQQQQQQQNHKLQQQNKIQKQPIPVVDSSSSGSTSSSTSTSSGYITSNTNSNSNINTNINTKYNEIKLEDHISNNEVEKQPSNKFGGTLFINNNIYEGGVFNDDVDVSDADSITAGDNSISHQPEVFVVDHDSVSISSASPSFGNNYQKISSTNSYFPSSTPNNKPITQTEMYLPPPLKQHQNDELPTRIPTGPYDVSSIAAEIADDGIEITGVSADGDVSNVITNSQSDDFTQSGITHPGVDAILLDEQQNDDGYQNIPIAISTSTPEYLSSSSTVTTTTEHIEKSTEKVNKVTYAKPSFRPKPPMKDSQGVSTVGNKYVLVPTINHNGSNNKNGAPSTKPTGAMSENDIESIESIILMLNDTKTGPQYDTGDSSTEAFNSYKPSTLYGQTGTTGAINYDKYGPSSYYITTKLPLSSPYLPSTSYVYNSQPTVRPMNVQSTISSSYGAVQHNDELSNNNNHYAAVPSSTLAPPVSNVNHYQQVSITNRPQILTVSSFTSPSTTNNLIYDTSTKKQPIFYDSPDVFITANQLPPSSTSVPSATTTTITVPTKKTKQPNTKTTTTVKPPSTSYITGPTTGRPKKKPTPSNKTPSHSSYSTTASPTRHPTIVTKPVHKNSPKPSSVIPPQLPPSYRPPTSNSYAGTAPEGVFFEHVIESKPINHEGYGEASVVFDQTDSPNPTVHITPKPTANLVTSSGWPQRPNIIVSKYTTPIIKSPTTSFIFSPGSSTQNYSPALTYVSSTPPSNFINADISGPSATGDGGYYGGGQIQSSQRPHIQSSTFYSQTLSPVTQFTVSDLQQQPVEYSTLKDEFYTSVNDLNNFPPVRNPNLNISAGGGSSSAAGGGGGGSNVGDSVSLHEYEISTPIFIEDQALNDKMGLLVSKIVESLQGNFENLAHVVYDDPVAPVKQRPVKGTTKKPVSGGQKATTKKPTATSVARPTNTRPGTVTTSKRPPVTRVTTPTTRKPTPNNSKRTTKKPATTLTNTTKKPVTKATTTRRPTTRPTKKIQTTTVQQNDEIEEDEEDEDDEEEEIVEDELEQTTAFGEGRLQCGVRPQIKSGRIVGGKGATFGEFPWQVLVRESTWLGLFTKNKCGGVLISKMYVVTAAHCQPGFLASLVAVFGEFDISGELEAKRSVTKNVKRVVVHREYDAATFENDLALLELESAIHYDTHIVPVCMPSDGADFTGRMATVTGWGRLKYGGGVPSVLQEVQVPIIENNVCQEMFHTAGHNKKILPSFLCAGYANGQKDSCEGDSGGPLVLQRDDGRWELAGTVSHGIKCAAPYLPGVYMRTTYYKPWLESVTGIH